MERLTKKAIGCFEYDLIDHKHKTAEFGTYNAFFDYNMAVRQLGKYENTGLAPEDIEKLKQQRNIYKDNWIKGVGFMEENENFIHNKYGYCYYSIEPNDTAIIYNLYIEPEYRKKGHAKKLIQLVIGEIREAGYNKEIQIEAHPREDSTDIENLVAFYERMGLKIL